MKIGDEVYIHGYVDEIRKDTVIIRNNGGYFGTVMEEIKENVRGEWTFVEDKLPKEVRSPGHGLCHVLVTTTKNFYPAVEQEIYANGKFFLRGEEDTKVLAWMHLPKPCRLEYAERSE